MFASIQTDCLEKHNFYRNNHGTPALEYSTTLAKEAQKVADALASQTDIEASYDMYDANYFIADWPSPRTISDTVENW